MASEKPTLTASTATRKLVHLAMVGFAFLLAYLDRNQALACALAALVFNLVLYPRIGKKTFKEDELKRGFSTAILLYPISVFFLILIFPPYIAAGAWAMMAFGDSAATICGLKWGTTPLPWNPKKTWEGLAAFITFGTLGCAILSSFVAMRNSREALDMSGFVFGALVAAVGAGFAESLASRIDDNIRVPAVAAVALWGLTQLALPPAIPVRNWILGVICSGVISLTAFKASAVNRDGLAAGFILGLLIFISLGLPGFMTLLCFFILGSLCTKIGYMKKSRSGKAQEGKGARGAKNALANGLVAVLFSLIGGWGAGESVMIAARFAFVGALAAAASDTVAGEIGQVWGRKPVLITTFRPVAPGTDGGVTITGTLAGAVAALLIGLVALAGKLISPPAAVALVFWAGLAGNLADSLLGALMELRGRLDNQEVNFLCTLVGALIPWLVIRT